MGVVLHVVFFSNVLIFFSFSAKEKKQKKTRLCILFPLSTFEIATISVISPHAFRATLWSQHFNSFQFVHKIRRHGYRYENLFL